MRSSLVTLFLLAAFLVVAAPARAIDVGDVAPEFEGKEFFNCESISLKELRGRLILFELFSTG